MNKCSYKRFGNKIFQCEIEREDMIMKKQVLFNLKKNAYSAFFFSNRNSQ